jgi:hypothetical protein
MNYGNLKAIAGGAIILGGVILVFGAVPDKPVKILQYIGGTISAISVFVRTYCEYKVGVADAPSGASRIKEGAISFFLVLTIKFAAGVLLLYFCFRGY